MLAAICINNKSSTSASLQKGAGHEYGIWVTEIWDYEASHEPYLKFDTVKNRRRQSEASGCVIQTESLSRNLLAGIKRIISTHHNSFRHLISRPKVLVSTARHSWELRTPSCNIVDEMGIGATLTS